MDIDELSLKTRSVLRRAGLENVPSAALIGIIVIGLIIILVCIWQFWPKPQTEFITTTNSSNIEKAQGINGSSEDTASTQNNEIVVDIEGAINAPGLYALPLDSRIGDVVDAAGGLTNNAAPGSTNLAQKLSDGDQIIIPSKDEIDQQNANAAAASVLSNSTNANTSAGKININTASAEELQQLSGVGPSLSERIIQYRESNGRFKTIEDLQNVSGIGETRFANIKDKICV